MRPTHPGIYAIVHLASGRRYIGSAANIDGRWRGHRSDLRKGRHSSPYLQHVWTKHGEHGFVFVVLETLPKDSKALKSREQYWLDLFPEMLLNAARHAIPGLHRPHTPEARLRMSQRMNGNQNGAGTHYHGKLTERNIVEIMHRFADGESNASLAEDFQTSPTHVSRITTRLIWWRVAIAPDVLAACQYHSRYRQRDPSYVAVPLPPPPGDLCPVVSKRPRYKRPEDRRPRPDLIPVVCGSCGKEMLRPPCRALKAHVSFCSIECRVAGAAERQRRVMARPEEREKIATANRGKKASAETRAKMSASQQSRRRLRRQSRGLPLFDIP